ncbi:sn-glycerol-3-phosphate ABC transporter ATP-binding protein UgpC [Vibrio lamellibrachiae]|uniref:ABC transporter ATP-binding protein n=1 Tax=Vibrio lamellibrachiae TaxID=2910253 RepID=UPI003D1034C3
MATLSFNNVNKSFGDTQIVKGFNLDVKDGEFIVLLGPSGCGKSTTLRMLAGLEDITDGEISIGDRIVNDLSPGDRNIAMVFQSYALYPHMTVYENIAFGLRISKLCDEEVDKKVQWAAEILELTPYLQRKPKALSGGQRQRVAMGRSMVRTPDVFLFDEPLSNLDAKLRGQMRHEIKALHKRLNKTTIYVTHDQIEALTLADRVVILRDGVIEQIGTPKEIYQNPINAFVAGFIGTPNMNLLHAKVEESQDILQLKLGKQSIELPKAKFKTLLDGQDVTFGVRPMDVSTAGESASDEPMLRIKSTVVTSELLGPTIQIDSLIGDQNFIVEVDANHSVKDSDELELRFSLDDIHLFCSSSGESLRNIT